MKRDGIPASVQAVIDEVSERYRLSEADLLGRRRFRRLTRPRQELFSLVRQRVKIGNAPASYPRIGRWLGFDHTTVLHGDQQHRARQEAEAAA